MKTTLITLLLGLFAAGCGGEKTLADSEPDQRLNQLGEVDAQSFCLQLSTRLLGELDAGEFKSLHCQQEGDRATIGVDYNNQDAACREERMICENKPMPSEVTRDSMQDCDGLSKHDLQDCDARLEDLQQCADEVANPLKERVTGDECGMSSVTSSKYEDRVSASCKLLLEHDDCGELFRSLW